MKTASQLYAALRRFQDAYAAALRPLCERTGMAQGAVDILLFLANNPAFDTARDIVEQRILRNLRQQADLSRFQPHLLKNLIHMIFISQKKLRTIA